MKKYIIAVLMIVLLFNIVLPVQAASEKYELPELDLSLAIPAGYDVFTRDMDRNDPLFNKYGISGDSFEEYLTSANIYLNAIAPDGSGEVVVTMSENAIIDFGAFDDTVLMEIAAALEEEYVNYGTSVSSCDIYHHSQLTFIRICFSASDQSVHGLQYYTIYDNKAMNFTIRSYTGPITVAQEDVISSIVDSICLSSYVDAIVTEKEAPAFTYTDNETGVEFVVPAGWEKADLSKEREFIDAKFTSTKDPALTIIYGSTDLWSEIPASERMGLKRSDLDHTFFTGSDIAEMAGASEPAKSVSYNGKEYYLAETVMQTDVYGMNLTVAMMHIIRIENGWMYWFQFGGGSEHADFDAVEELMNSIHYPEANQEQSGLPAIVSVVIAGVIAVIVMIAFFQKRKHRVVPSQNTEMLQDNKSSGLEEAYVFCHMCGEKLPKDSSFCRKCGTKITEER